MENNNIMEKIKLTTDNSTIHVDDVRLQDGVYAKESNYKDLFFLTKNKQGDIEGTFTDGRKHGVFSSLREYVNVIGIGVFYTIPGNKLIVTQKNISVQDLDQRSHVGYKNKLGYKGAIHFIGNGRFLAINNNGDGAPCNSVEGVHNTSFTISEAITNVKNITEAYRFPTRQKLYEWLSKEDSE